MIGAPWSVDPQPKRLDHRRPESNIGFEATPEFLGRRVGTGFATRNPGDESSCRKPGLWLPHSAVSLWLGCKAGHVAGCDSLGTSKESLVRWFPPDVRPETGPKKVLPPLTTPDSSFGFGGVAEAMVDETDRHSLLVSDAVAHRLFCRSAGQCV